ncbi:MAG: UDP-3-O-(3-hydroxymyristoyl)glucosamine N-acyltransferase [Rhodobacter sp.]|nr:UDP-3-O-(3-hydroxymyristoyl)glucosamine N-acyltransferase [Rhodobacter sp.]MCY4168603.1 UDP-3-O-(3-hydroxymyristoyl)glucosamine N-acyltransferase [Rhodobacter sp.]MCY4240949.1 UDP-3-O-(3-hydroxymyristoyl)glucosamine N-acyltransferase [Rhodobacter sp.]
MGFRVSEIAAALDATAYGDTGLSVERAAEPADAGADDLALAMSPKYASGLSRGNARVALLWDGADWESYGLAAAITVRRPRFAMSGLTALMDTGPAIASGIHPTAVIDETAEIGQGAAIGPLVVIEAGVRIGPGARIASHSSIARDACIGSNALLHSGVRVGRQVRIGDRFIAQPGAVIGSDGFSFVTPEKSRAESIGETLGDIEGAGDAQRWSRIHTLGSVLIGDDVEIGATTCIDAGTIRSTRIGNRTKIDNQVHIAHNCEIGNDCLIAGQVGMAGSARIGNNVVLAGKVGITDNTFVGDGVIAGGATMIMSNAPAGRILLGYPAVKMESHIAIYKVLRRLPRLAAKIAELQKAVPKPDPGD